MTMLVAIDNDYDGSDYDQQLRNVTTVITFRTTSTIAPNSCEVWPP